MTRAARLAATLAAVAVLAASCGEGRLAFREDRRVEVTSPDDGESVTLPFRLTWTTDLAPAADGGPYFAVFVDRAPIRPGQSLRALADDSCDRTPDCPDLDYLRQRHVFVTDEHWVTIDAVPRSGSSQRTRARDRHEATIVLLDAEGHRIGESAYVVEFEVGED